MKKKKEVKKMTFTDIVINLTSQFCVGEGSVERLFKLTTDIEKLGARFAHVTNYRSDKSGNTENASFTIQLNFSYENMKKQEQERLQQLDVRMIDVEAFDYSRIDTDGRTIEQYKTEVRAMLPIALAEMLQPKKEKENSNDVWLNNILVFNLNSKKLSIVGEKISKSIIEEGEYKIEKNKPITIAKKLIGIQAKLRTSKYRRFLIENFDGSVKLQGETLQIGGA